MTAATPLNHSVSADARSVGQAREAFSRWLQQFDLDESRHCDIVLAVNEALANAAEFAYAHVRRPGAVAVRADHDSAALRLSVTVSDKGAWREPDPDPDPTLRGRGIPLMQALSDAVDIRPSSVGTTVNLRFDNVGDLKSALL